MGYIALRRKEIARRQKKLEMKREERAIYVHRLITELEACGYRVRILKNGWFDVSGKRLFHRKRTLAGLESLVKVAGAEQAEADRAASMEHPEYLD